MAVFGAELARATHAEAPGIRLRFKQAPTEIIDNTGGLLSTADGLLMPQGIISGFPTVELYRDSWVYVVADGNPEVGEHPTLDDLARLLWVT